MASGTLIIACGALAHELVAILRRNRWEHIKIRCLPARLHNTPALIPGAVADLIEKYRDDYPNVFVAYGDCGTAGELDRVLERYGVSRIPGAHCYEFFAGADVFGDLHDDEPGTFYLTDFLVRHFDRLIVHGLGIRDHPELLPMYFGNYRRIVYLAQNPTPERSAEARRHAEFLGLEYEERHTGLAPVENIIRESTIQWLN